MSNAKFLFIIVALIFGAAFLARKAFGITGNPLDTAISNKQSAQSICGNISGCIAN